MTMNYAFARMDARLAPPQGEELLRVLTEHGPDVTILVHADATCYYVTPASAAVLGRPASEITGTDLRDLAVEPDRDVLDDLLVRLAGRELEGRAEFRISSEGQLLWLEANGRRLPAAAGAIISLRDISARKQQEAVLEEANSLLRHRAAIDTVTGLLSRDHLVATIERELRRSQRDRTELGVVALGLADFRRFTDLYGWEVADTAVHAVAEAISASMHRPADVAGRMDGDEFALLLPASDGTAIATVAQRVVASVAALGIPHAGSPLGIMTAVAGTATATPGCDVLALLRRAHCAMRTAKGDQIGSLLPLPLGA